MAVPLGAHSPKVTATRELLQKKGRREQGRFIVEGPTLIGEALASGVVLHEAFATAAALERYERARELERSVPVHLVDDRTFGRLSDLETPTGILAVAELPQRRAADLLAEPGLVLLLAEINDPGNAGTLIRSAEAFGVKRVIFGAGGAEPFHPKVVRSAMGSIFRTQVATAAPEDLPAALDGWTVLGLDAKGEPLDGVALAERTLLAVGHERHGLGPWAPLCTALAAIPMHGPTESLNAAVAGSIALYEVSKRLVNEGRTTLF